MRHLGDGLEGNAVSKAALRLAAEELAAAHAAVHYFPAYEVLNDDLRDYRFYADDLVHPSAQAIQYVWEKFIPAVLSDEARRLLPDVRHIVVAAAHRPRNPRSEAYREFCRRRIGEIRGTAAGRFSGRGGIFPQMYRNKFVNLRPITHTQ